MSNDWATAGCLAILLGLCAVLAIQRLRLVRRLRALEGELVGRSMDLAAARDRIRDLQKARSGPSRGGAHPVGTDPPEGTQYPDRWDPPR